MWLLSKSPPASRGKAKPGQKESETPFKPESLGGKRAWQPDSPPTGKANPNSEPKSGLTDYQTTTFLIAV
jgi:hypothetical protein